MSTTNKEATELIHLSYDGNFQLETDARVILCKVIHDNESSTNNKIDDEKNRVEKDSGDGDGGDNVIRVELQLDKTSMHPQGGGQPTDVGTIITDNKDCTTVAKIDKVTIDRSTGIVTHSGTVLTNTAKNNNNNNNNDAAAAVYDDLFPPNSSVKVTVDATNRTLLSECHTAGHVVDAAMAKCNKHLPPTKGYHFLDGPYVEYKGTIDIADRTEFLSQLQESYQQLINEDIDTQIQTLAVEEAESLCNRVAKNFNMKDFTNTSSSDENPPTVRVVTVAGWNCPCGGTHVKSTGLLKERGWCVKGLKCKKGVVRVRYGMKD
jgi:Ser-tRNA(Ala) deacylase AlaX